LSGPLSALSALSAISFCGSSSGGEAPPGPVGSAVLTLLLYPTSSSVLVNWTAVPDATLYTLYVAGEVWDTSANNNPYEIGLEASVDTEIYVVASIGGVPGTEGDPSNTVVANTDESAGPVLSITGYPETTSVDLSWTTPAGSFSGYEIWIDDITLFDTVLSSPANVYGLTFGTDYSIYVKAVFDGYYGITSNTVVANTYGAYSLYDTFTDIDDTSLEDHTPEAGGPWTTTGVVQIKSNMAEGISSAGARLFTFALVPTPTANGYIQASIFTGNRNLGVVINVQDVDHLWMAWVDSNATILYHQNGENNFIPHGSAVGVFPSVIKAVANDDTIEVYGDDVLLITYTVADRPLKAETKKGLMIYDPVHQHTKFVDCQAGV